MELFSKLPDELQGVVLSIHSVERFTGASGAVQDATA
jgi:hypothetical protein